MQSEQYHTKCLVWVKNVNNESEHFTYHTKCSLCIIYIYMTQTEHFVCHIYINEAKWTFNISYKMFGLCYICKWCKVNISHIIQNVHFASFTYNKLNIYLSYIYI